MFTTYYINIIMSGAAGLQNLKRLNDYECECLDTPSIHEVKIHGGQLESTQKQPLSITLEKGFGRNRRRCYSSAAVL